MKIGVLGTGMVGNVIASKLVALAHVAHLWTLRSLGNVVAAPARQDTSFDDGGRFDRLAKGAMRV